ncbi:hypothetical protein TNCV_4445441 [Trichonephila clavipes]|nr:hypothetical protein TNCV_4445441 [Trichonephila clavipes]
MPRYRPYSTNEQSNHLVEVLPSAELVCAELGSTPILREITPPPHPATNFTRGLVARRLFRVPPCYEGTIHLQTSMSSPGFESRPYGTAVSVDHYTGWATTLTL